MKRKKRRNPWDVRAASLKSLGFADYGEYIESPLWRKIRRKVYATKGKKCRYCGRKASQIHHHSYALAVLSGKNVEPMSPVCWDCHEFGSVTSEGHIRTPAAATRAMRRRAKKEHPDRVIPAPENLPPEIKRLRAGQKRARIYVYLNKARASLALARNPRAKRIRKTIRKLEAKLAR